MKRLQLVIFDCDGVLFDSREANRAYYNQILFFFDLAPMDEEELNYVHTHHVEASVRYLFRNHKNLSEKAEAYRKALNYRPFLVHMILEPDLLQFLDRIRPLCRTAISTNRTTTMPLLLTEYGLTPYFDKIVTAQDVKNPKPHPEALNLILDYFNVTVDESIYVGDSHVDREHTSAVGMRLVSFKNSNLNAEFHVSSFLEILDLPIWSQRS